MLDIGAIWIVGALFAVPALLWMLSDIRRIPRRIWYWSGRARNPWIGGALVGMVFAWPTVIVAIAWARSETRRELLDDLAERRALHQHG